MTHKPLLYDDVVKEIREHVSTANALARITVSDDSDMWAVGRGEASPMTRLDTSVADALRAAQAVGERLLGLGAPAAPAVAKGLRTVGRWRENLLPFAETHRDLPVVREALELVAKRTRDPLAPRAFWLAYGRPSAFSAFIGGYMGSSYEVVLDGEALVYKQYSLGYEPRSEERLTPTAADWRAFVEALRGACGEVRVDTWRDGYADHNVCDGTTWSLHLVAGDLRIGSSGLNDYPTDFEGFLRAVRRLIGGREFA